MSKEKQTVRVQLATVIGSIPVIETILTKRMPSRTAFKVSMLRKQIAPLSETFDEIRNKLAKEASLRDDDGNIVFANDEKTAIKFADDESREHFQNEMQTLLEEEHDLAIDKLTFDELDRIKDWEPTPIEIEQIEYLINE